MSTGAGRIRGRKLQRINRRLRQKQPLCVQCQHEGRLRLGTQTDHIVPLCKGGLDVEENRQRLCDECHAIKTARDRGYRLRVPIGEDGWPER